jgi:hypothetical protein
VVYGFGDPCSVSRELRRELSRSRSASGVDLLVYLLCAEPATREGSELRIQALCQRVGLAALANPYEARNPPQRSRSAPQPWPSGRFVLESGDRKRALAAVFLRNVVPTRRQCPVRSSFDPRVQILDPAIESSS